MNDLRSTSQIIQSLRGKLLFNEAEPKMADRSSKDWKENKELALATYGKEGLKDSPKDELPRAKSSRESHREGKSGQGKKSYRPKSGSSKSPGKKKNHSKEKKKNKEIKEVSISNVIKLAKEDGLLKSEKTLKSERQECSPGNLSGLKESEKPASILKNKKKPLPPPRKFSFPLNTEHFKKTDQDRMNKMGASMKIDDKIYKTQEDALNNPNFAQSMRKIDLISSKSKGLTTRSKSGQINLLPKHSFSIISPSLVKSSTQKILVKSPSVRMPVSVSNVSPVRQLSTASEGLPPSLPTPEGTVSAKTKTSQPFQPAKKSSIPELQNSQISQNLQKSQKSDQIPALNQSPGSRKHFKLNPTKVAFSGRNSAKNQNQNQPENGIFKESDNEAGMLKSWGKQEEEIIKLSGKDLVKKIGIIQREIERVAAKCKEQSKFLGESKAVR